MVVTRFKDTDTAYIELEEGAEVVRTEHISDDVLLDFDATGRVVAITIEHAGEVELPFVELIKAADGRPTGVIVGGPGASTGSWKVYEVQEGDWFVARTAHEAIRTAEALCGYSLDAEELSAVHALSDGDMCRLHYWDSEDTDPLNFSHWVCPVSGKPADSSCRWNGDAYEYPHPYPLGHVVMENRDRRTFAEQLERMVAGGLGGPCFFASCHF